MDYKQLFEQMHPGFFREASIRAMPKDEVYTELVMDLRKDVPNRMSFGLQEGITFGGYHGRLCDLHEAVAMVEEGWVQYFTEECRPYCAFDGETIAAFCCLTDWEKVRGFRIGGPGCVGTLPKYRRKGIGLEMVRLATEELRKEGFDFSWIHYTHLESWYGKLGYRAVLRWNGGGILASQ